MLTLLQDADLPSHEIADLLRCSAYDVEKAAGQAVKAGTLKPRKLGKRRRRAG